MRNKKSRTTADSGWHWKRHCRLSHQPSTSASASNERCDSKCLSKSNCIRNRIYVYEYVCGSTVFVSWSFERRRTKQNKTNSLTTILEQQQQEQLNMVPTIFATSDATNRQYVVCWSLHDACLSVFLFVCLSISPSTWTSWLRFSFCWCYCSCCYDYTIAVVDIISYLADFVAGYWIVCTNSRYLVL